MNILDILLILLLASTGNCKTEIQFEVQSHSKDCVNGYRANIDAYSIAGTVGPELTAFADAGWQPLLTVEVLQVGDKEFTSICDLRIRKHGETCGPDTIYCYCNEFNTATKTAHFVIKQPAEVGHSLGTARGWLQKSNGDRFYSTKNKTIPLIYDVKDAKLILYVNGVPADTKSTSCGARFKSRDKNTIKLCCSKAAMPCYPRLAFNGIVVADKKSPCVEYTFTDKAETVNITKSYSVCSLTNYRQSGYCAIVASVASTTVKPTTSKIRAASFPSFGIASATVKTITSTALAATVTTTPNPTSTSTVPDIATTSETTSASTVTEVTDEDTNRHNKLHQVLSTAIPLVLALGVIILVIGGYFLSKQGGRGSQPVQRGAGQFGSYKAGGEVDFDETTHEGRTDPMEKALGGSSVDP